MTNSKFRKVSIVLTVALGSACSFFVVAQTDNVVPYPVGFRQWVHVKSTIVTPRHSTFGKEPCTTPCMGGIYQFYANAKALEGYKTGKFPEGSVIADEVLETNQASYSAEVFFEAGRRGVGVMVKDSVRYAATGGWGYESFKGDSQTEGRLSVKEANACYTCHLMRKDRDFVFTSYKE